MNTNQIYQGLITKGYNEKQALGLSMQLSELSNCLLDRLSIWLTTGETPDYEIRGFSINDLMTKYNLKYPAALLSIDWVIKEPAVAIPVILKGIR